MGRHREVDLFARGIAVLKSKYRLDQEPGPTLVMPLPPTESNHQVDGGRRLQERDQQERGLWCF